MAVVLGWWGAKPRSLGKFVRLYADRGFAVCQFIAEGRESFSGPARRQEIAAALLDEVERRWCDWARHGLDQSSRGAEWPPPVVFHVMSNNGAALYTAVLACARLSGRHEWVQGATRGVVFDCAPGALTLSTFVRAFLANRPPATAKLGVLGPPLALLMALLYTSRHWPVRTLAATLWLYALSSWRSLTQNEEYHGQLAEDPLACPQMFLYSSADVLVDSGIVEHLISRRRATGVEVMAKRWSGVPHMALLRDKPAEYVAALDGYLARIGLGGKPAS